MGKTKSEESKELDNDVEQFLKKGGEIKELDTSESKLKEMSLSNRFFAKTNFYLFSANKKK
jgi:hypothetical protein|tara:strand:+ start:345 stop:527 length:183 start_codon:yes stop_codon:yes gene_type:complete